MRPVSHPSTPRTMPANSARVSRLASTDGHCSAAAEQGARVTTTLTTYDQMLAARSTVGVRVCVLDLDALPDRVVDERQGRADERAEHADRAAEQDADDDGRSEPSVPADEPSHEQLGCPRAVRRRRRARHDRGAHYGAACVASPGPSRAPSSVIAGTTSVSVGSHHALRLGARLLRDLGHQRRLGHGAFEAGQVLAQPLEGDRADRVATLPARPLAKSTMVDGVGPGVATTVHVHGHRGTELPYGLLDVGRGRLPADVGTGHGERTGGAQDGPCHLVVRHAHADAALASRRGPSAGSTAR